MLNAAAFAKMKDGVTVVNMSRGPLIDTPALIDALNSGRWDAPDWTSLRRSRCLPTILFGIWKTSISRPM